MVPGGGDVDGVVAAGEGGHVDGAAAGFGVGNDSVPPIVVDGYIIGCIDIINDGDYAQLTVVIDIGHISRDVHLGVSVVV